MNKKILAKEWIILVIASFFGFVFIPAFFSLGDDGFKTFERFYNYLLKGKMAVWSWAVAPYLIVQSIRLTAWAIKQLRMK